MQTALETLFLSISRDRRVFPEDDPQACQCFAEGVRCGLSIGVAWWDPGDYPVKTGIPCR